MMRQKADGHRHVEGPPALLFRSTARLKEMVFVTIWCPCVVFVSVKVLCLFVMILCPFEVVLCFL